MKNYNNYPYNITLVLKFNVSAGDIMCLYLKWLGLFWELTITANLMAESQCII
jgi:hypothetical protein